MNREESREKVKKGLEQIKGMKWDKDTFLIIVLVGILLFIIALPMENRKNTSLSEEKAEVLYQKQDIQSDRIKNNETDNEEFVYRRQLEEQLEEALAYMEGVGKVKVMITIQSSAEQIVEKDNKNSRSGTTESDAEGGLRNINEMDNEEITIYKEDGDGNQSPYVIKKILPVIEGVVVVAQGGGNSYVCKNITEVIQSLFNVEANRIKVVKMKS